MATLHRENENQIRIGPHRSCAHHYQEIKNLLTNIHVHKYIYRQLPIWRRLQSCQQWQNCSAEVGLYWMSCKPSRWRKRTNSTVGTWQTQTQTCTILSKLISSFLVAGHESHLEQLAKELKLLSFLESSSQKKKAKWSLANTDYVKWCAVSLVCIAVRTRFYQN